jgi:hypothetical protein
MRWTGSSSIASRTRPPKSHQDDGRFAVGQTYLRPREAGGQKAYGGAWSGPQFVLTHEPPDATEPTVSCLSGDVRDAIATALEAAAGKNMVVFGANVARQCFDEGLVDEVVIHLAPVLLGAASDSPKVIARDGSN